jgi:DNA-binding transcriptional regulator LsrR (DeoR family)
MNNTIQGGEGGQITAINCSESKMKNGIHTTTSIENKEETEMVTELSPSDLAKKAAAYACGEAEIKSGMSLGVGSGTTMKFFIDWLNEKSKDGHIKDIRCVPTSFQV